MHDKINITRQIIIGGRNRYLLNSHNVQANQIQNLFHSVSLNVNNPHFLIMQGRITKVINMKPIETLSMIEEAAGTRMYENKKCQALRTLEKKQNKVDEINRLLSEEITPTLEKLQRERSNYMLWVSNNNEIERLQRFCVAYEYMQVQNRLNSKNHQLEEMEEALLRLSSEIVALTDSDNKIGKEMQEWTAQRDTQRTRDLKQLEDQFSKSSKDLASTESRLKNRLADLEGQKLGRQKGLKHIDDMRTQLETKVKAYEHEKAVFDKLVEEEERVRKDIEKAQWSMQALTAGMSTKQTQEGDSEGAGRSLREELLETQTSLSVMESDQKKKTLGISHLGERISFVEEKVGKSKVDGKKLMQEMTMTQSVIDKRKAELGRIGFDPEIYAGVQQKVRQAESSLHSLQERIDALRAYLGGIDFNYADPWANFDRSAVKGVVAKLFTISPDFGEYARALEVCAGGKLFFVVVDNEDTGKALLQKGQLRRRVTIIPLNKVVDHTIHPNTVRTAQSVAPAGSELYPALQIIGYEREVQSAMKYVFGGFLVCDTPETAKKVTFHPNVKVRSVTKDGDIYDPAGTLTGGSAPKGGGLLVKLQELGQLEQQLAGQQRECAKVQAQLQGMRDAALKYTDIEQDLKCKEHELSLIQERISHSEHHTAELALKDMRDQVATFQAEIKAMPEEKKRLEAQVKQLQKDIKNMESNRDGDIQHFEKQIEQLKATAKLHATKLEKQREKTEQVSVELDVMRNELSAQEGRDEVSGQSNDGLAAEVEKLQTVFNQQKAASDALSERLGALRGELARLDTALGELTTRLSTNKQQREEKELEQKKVTHKVQQLQKDDKEVHLVVARLEKQHTWIEKEKNFFGKAGTDFDFDANSYPDNKKRHDDLQTKQKTLGKSINKKAMAMYEKAEQEYQDLLSKRDIILNDKRKIEAVILDLDEKKQETLRRTWIKVNKDLDSIFSTLLPHASAKLAAPPGFTETEGLEIKVAFGGVWKASLSELSGGQRSLLALSLVLALLLFKPAPMYILDEIDSALDLSHTQNIGHMIRTHFPHSQFIVVSLKEGMFNNANVLFRTRFVDGTSTVARYAMRDDSDRVAVPDGEKDGKKKRKVAGA
mmetsp:Transcript_16265/g.44167  ORF Transcript_16265/g.44167 Transcript_16265/m.44167 type:complete len:1112 (-) Transcript_16265:405-3740(-)